MFRKHACILMFVLLIISTDNAAFSILRLPNSYATEIVFMRSLGRGEQPCRRIRFDYFYQEVILSIYSSQMQELGHEIFLPQSYPPICFKLGSRSAAI